MRLFDAYFLILPKGNSKFQLSQFKNQSPLYMQPFAVLNKCVDILKVFCFENIDNMTALFQKNNLDII